MWPGAHENGTRPRPRRARERHAAGGSAPLGSSLSVGFRGGCTCKSAGQRDSILMNAVMCLMRSACVLIGSCRTATSSAAPPGAARQAASNDFKRVQSYRSTYLAEGVCLPKADYLYGAPHP